MGEPNYVAKRSAWTAVTPLRVIFFWLIIPLIVMLVDIAVKKRDMLCFYDDCIIQKSGLLSKRERRSAFMGIVSVSVNQTFWQRICGYGDVQVDVAGKWDINTNGLANPNGLKEYLQDKMVSGKSVQGLYSL